LLLHFMNVFLVPVPGQELTFRLRPGLDSANLSSHTPSDDFNSLRGKMEQNPKGTHSSPISLISSSASGSAEPPIKKEGIVKKEAQIKPEKSRKGKERAFDVEDDSDQEEEHVLDLLTKEDIDIENDDQWKEDPKASGEANISEIDKQFGITVSDRQATEKKVNELFLLFPHVDRETIGNYLQVDEGDMTIAFKSLEDDFGLKGTVKALLYAKQLKDSTVTSSESTSVTGSSRKRKGDDHVSFWSIL